MYLGKPVLMVPAHIEQDCNAHDAMRAGAGIISDSFDLKPLLRFAGTYSPNRTFVRWVRSVNDVLFWNWKNWLHHNQQLLQYQHLLIIYRYETE